MFKKDMCFEVGQSYFAKCSWSCDTDIIITITKRTKGTIYFLWTSKKHGCDGVIHKARICRTRRKDLNGSGEVVEVGRNNSLMSGRYFCAWYDLIGRMKEEEEFLLSEGYPYMPNKTLTREDLLRRAARSWAWCFAE